MPIRFAILFAALPVLSAEAGANDGVKLQALQGSPVVVTTRPAKSGGGLAAGDRVQTKVGESAQVVFPDGSEVFVGPGTDLAVGESQGKAPSANLNSGHVLVIVQKPKVVEAASGGKPKFVLRTKTATMGVRGTRFAVDTNQAGESAEVHTIEGVVEVAPTDAALEAGSGVRTTGGESLQIASGSLGTPQKFEVLKFLDSLKEQYPTAAQGDRLSAPRQEAPATTAPGAGDPNDPLNAPKVKKPKEL